MPRYVFYVIYIKMVHIVYILKCYGFTTKYTNGILTMPPVKTTYFTPINIPLNTL